MLRIAKLRICALPLLLGTATTAHAQLHAESDDSPVVIITAPDAQPGAAFGTAISASGDRLLVGAPLHNTTAGTNAGQAYFFDADGKHLHTVSAPDGQPHAFFGFAVAAPGEVVAVGAAGHDTDAGDEAGQVYLFAPDGTHLVTIAAPDGHPLAQFGFAIAAVADRLLVSSNRQHVDGHAFAGQAYLFDSQGEHLQTFTAPEPQASAAFGHSVAAVGDLVLIGAWSHDTAAGASAGQAYLFAQDGTHLQTFAAPDGMADAQFGVAVAAVGERVLVGAYGHEGLAGRAYLFDQDGTHLQTFAATDPQPGERFGFAVAAVGDDVLVGAHTSDTDAGSEAGRAYLFSQDGKLLDTFESTNAKPFASFGQVVRGWGNDVVVGAPRAATSAGRAYVFQRPVGTEPPAERRTPALEAPFPNPAARSATVAFTLPTGSDARLELVDVMGRRVAVLADGPHAAGRHVLTLDAAGLAGGVYVLRLTAGRHAAARRVSVTR